MNNKSMIEKINSLYTHEIDSVGSAKLVRFHVTKDDVAHAKFMAALHHNESEYYGFEPGDYTKLTVDGETVMSNTAMEIRTNSEFIRKATGDVLIGGLGIGLVAIAIAEKDDVNSITIIEKNIDVINLVHKFLVKHPDFLFKVNIIVADVFTYNSKDKFDVMYFDIWNECSGDNFVHMKKLSKKYQKNKREPSSLILHWRKSDSEYLYKENVKLEKRILASINIRQTHNY